MDMLLDLFRKRVIASRDGLALFYALGFFIPLTIASSLRLETIIMNAGLGILFGLVMSNKFHKNNKYFVQNIQRDEYDLTRKYDKMFKDGAVPSGARERLEYLDHLDALEKINARSMPKEVLSLLFLLVMFALSVGMFGINVLNFLFLLAMILATRGLIQSKSNLKKINKLRRQIRH